MFNTLLFQMMLMMLWLVGETTHDFSTDLEPMIKSLGNRLPSPYFYSFLGRCSFFFHSSSSLAIWGERISKPMVYWPLESLLSCQVSMKQGLHIMLGEVPKDTGLPLFQIIDTCAMGCSM